MTPPGLPEPPSSFAGFNPIILPAGFVLHRNHAAWFEPTQFNPCLGQPSRFAPFTNAAGECVATLYAATTREAAAFETIFHDIEAEAPFKTVRLDVVEARSISEISPLRDLRLAGLFAPDLKAWAVRRGDLIDTPKSSYHRTVLWAQAVHRAHPDVEGLICTSRQCDPQRCVVLFGDRVAATEFVLLQTVAVAKSPGALLELRGFGRRAGITIVN